MAATQLYEAIRAGIRRCSPLQNRLKNRFYFWNSNGDFL
jgi:hypothetical protein